MLLNFKRTFRGGQDISWIAFYHATIRYVIVLSLTSSLIVFLANSCPPLKETSHYLNVVDNGSSCMLITQLCLKLFQLILSRRKLTFLPIIMGCYILYKDNFVILHKICFQFNRYILCILRPNRICILEIGLPKMINKISNYICAAVIMFADRAI